MGSKKIFAVVSSPRRGGNSELLVDEFIRGARESGHMVDKVCLREKKIAPCIACEACLRNGGTCVQKDDMAEILTQIIAADVIVLSTPVYYYSICAQLKMMIDRTLAGGGKMKNKEFYFIATAADGDHAMECTMNDLQGFVNCVPGSTVKGKVYGSAFGVGEIKGKPAMEQAYTYGKTVNIRVKEWGYTKAGILILYKDQLLNHFRERMEDYHGIYNIKQWNQNANGRIWSVSGA